MPTRRSLEMEALSQQLDSIIQQMAQALASGNKAAFSSLADEMSAAVSQTQQQLNSSVGSLVSGYTSMLSQQEGAVQSAIP